jgi:hypothetical protein
LFVLISLISEGLLLFVAAQTGFLGGPRVLGNMAADRWMPSRFSSLSDRLVMQNGIMLMGLAALITIISTGGSVFLLVVLYSINVFITFCFSQAGMVRHWWMVRDKEKKWKSKIVINGLGLFFTTFILLSVVFLKFNEGGWVTLIVTGFLVFIAIVIKRHYRATAKMLQRLNTLVEVAGMKIDNPAVPKADTNAKTAAVLVNGFNGLGLHTVMGVVKHFGREFKNFVFIQVGVIDADNFKGVAEIKHLEAAVHKNLNRYVTFVNNNGYYAEGVSSIGTEIVEQVEKLTADVCKRFPNIVFFGGQLVFKEETWLDKLLHNHTVFELQNKFNQQGIPFIILPIRV